MNFNEYQVKAHETAIYPEQNALPYVGLGVGNEAGELQGLFKKSLRGDFDKDFDGAFVTAVSKEIGDVLWYLAEICTVMGLNLNEVAVSNLLKLADRKERNVLKGSGDDR